MNWNLVEKCELYGKGGCLKQHISNQQHISNNLKLLPLE